MVEHLFRHESGKMVATLTRIFGLDHLTLAEDVVQEALAKALKTWPYHGVPENPAAWIMRTSRNLALDVVRREKVFRDKVPEVVSLLEGGGTSSPSTAALDGELADDRLRLMFVCCHPLVPEEAQVALALKTLCGFSVGEIARAFLTTDAAIAKRLTRAKQKLAESGVRFEIPEGEELGRRLEVVLHCLYLLFNEGYKASSGEKLIREDLCLEAIRLTELLVAHPAGNQPRTHALLALMLLNTARLSTRLDGDGNLLRLKEQDRSRWDAPMMARGFFHLAASGSGEDLTEYHLQAGIAACHCAAKDYESTDWTQILALYDRWVQRSDSPVVALNRAIVIATVHGPKAGLEAVGRIQDLEALHSYHLLHAVLGEFESRLDRLGPASAHFKKSLELAELPSEKAFLRKRMEECDPSSSP